MKMGKIDKLNNVPNTKMCFGYINEHLCCICVYDCMYVSRFVNIEKQICTLIFRHQKTDKHISLISIKLF